MFDEFDFSVTQLTAIKDAMQNIPAYRPDNKEPAFVLGLIEASNLARGTYGSKETTLKLARGNCKGACKEGRKLAIKAYGLMKDLYRSDPGATESIVSIPTRGDSVPRTLKRMTKTSEVWAQLPNMPGTTSPFVAGETTKENFDTALATLRTHQAAVSQANTLFQIAEGKLPGHMMPTRNSSARL